MGDHVGSHIKLREGTVEERCDSAIEASGDDRPFLHQFTDPAELYDGAAEAIAREIIPRLLLLHRDDAEAERDVMPAGIRAEDRAAFIDLLADGRSSEAVTLVERIAARGVPNQQLLLGLMAAAARELGALWDEDRRDFAEVTIALCTLHTVLRLRDWSDAPPPRLSANAPSILLATFSGEQHVFGVTIVAEFFRQAGWSVALMPGSAQDEVRRAVSGSWYDVIGLSSSRSLPTAAAAGEVAALRTASRNPEVKVMVGGPAFDREPSSIHEIGADAWASDAASAPVVAARLQNASNTRN